MGTQVGGHNIVGREAQEVLAPGEIPGLIPIDIPFSPDDISL